MPMARPRIWMRDGEIASTSAMPASATETFFTGHAASIVRDSPTITSIVSDCDVVAWITGCAEEDVDAGAVVGDAAGCVACADVCDAEPSAVTAMIAAAV